MNRWYATTEPQHMLPATVACSPLGNARRISEQFDSKPATREAPPSA
jgi:hypothetical protein